MPSFSLPVPYPTLLCPYILQPRLTLPTFPLLNLTLPPHLVTNRTPSQPYWLTWYLCFGCLSLSDSLPDSRSTILVHPVSRCALLSYFIPSHLLSPIFLILPLPPPGASPSFSIESLLLFMLWQHSYLPTLFLPPPPSPLFPHLPHMYLWTFFLDWWH